MMKRGAIVLVGLVGAAVLAAADVHSAQESLANEDESVAAQDATSLLEVQEHTALQTGKIKYLRLMRWSIGLAIMSANVLIFQRDIKRRNSNKVFLELDEDVADHVLLQPASDGRTPSDQSQASGYGYGDSELEYRMKYKQWLRKYHDPWNGDLPSINEGDDRHAPALPDEEIHHPLYPPPSESQTPPNVLAAEEPPRSDNNSNNDNDSTVQQEGVGSGSNGATPGEAAPAEAQQKGKEAGVQQDNATPALGTDNAPAKDKDQGEDTKAVEGEGKELGAKAVPKNAPPGTSQSGVTLGQQVGGGEPTRPETTAATNKAEAPSPAKDDHHTGKRRTHKHGVKVRAWSSGSSVMVEQDPNSLADPSYSAIPRAKGKTLQFSKHTKPLHPQSDLPPSASHHPSVRVEGDEGAFVQVDDEVNNGEGSNDDAAAFLQVEGDICDIDIDPILIRLDWGEFYVEIVYEVMEKYIRKMREEEAAQKGGPSSGAVLTPGDAIKQVRALLETSFDANAAHHPEDPDPEFLHPASNDRYPDSPQLENVVLARLLKAGIQVDDSDNANSELRGLGARGGEPLVPQLMGSGDAVAQSEQAALLKAAITRSSFLEVGTTTRTQGILRWLCQLFLYFFNIFMRIGGTICEEKDDKVGAALQLEEGSGAMLGATPPSSPEDEMPTPQEVAEAERQVCPNRSCVLTPPDHNLDVHKRFVMSMEKEAMNSGFGPFKHMPVPGVAPGSEGDDGWSLQRTLHAVEMLKQEPPLVGVGTRPAALGTGGCMAFYRKAIWRMIVLGWMTWWGMYYTILYWIKTNTKKA